MTNSDVVGLAERVKVLEAENDALRDALAPFASVAAINDQIASHLPDDTPCREFFPGIWPTLGDCRKARAAIEAYEQARAAANPSASTVVPSDTV